LECVHPICYDCFEKEAKKDLFEMKCKICNKQISDQLKKDVLQDKFEQLEKIALMKVLGGDLVKCPYPDCGEQNVFEPGNVDYNVKDASGKLLSRQAAENYAKNRCRCGFCRRDFCKQCGLMPYHLGKTCEEYKHHEQAKKCRFCDTEIKGNNMGPDDDVCNSSDCRERYRISCKKKLRCGHKCFGVNGERNCPPCLDKECKQYGGQFDQDKDAYCPICYTEGLGSSPIVVTSCGHYMHYQCIKKRLETKWIGPKITFNHCLCPSCNKWFDIDNVPELQKMINENKKLYESIKEMALKRLKFEDLDKDPRLTDPKSPWFGKKVEFAMKRLSYYMCFVCKKPYFAGRRECGNDPNMNNDDPNKNYNPADCVCGKDANLSGVAGKTNCPKHGKDFIEYKCKFCCKIASWFCWGTTHFCEDCHKRQCNGDYVSKYPKERLPKCNKSTCEVGGNHPPNGEEYALGCSICRNNAENDKGF
jgi:E3 ubiquitin-protein ligase MYCBP2